MAGQSRVYIVFVGPGYDTARLHVNRSVIGPDGVVVRRHAGPLTLDLIEQYLQEAVETVAARNDA